MSVNIFGAGSKSKSSLSGQRGPAGIGFKYLDEERNFDIGNKRLGNVGLPIELTDAVSKIYTDQLVKEKAYINQQEVVEVRTELRSLKEELNIASFENVRSISSLLTQIDRNRQELDGSILKCISDINGTGRELNIISGEMQDSKASFTKMMTDLNIKYLANKSDIIILKQMPEDIVINKAEIEGLKKYVEVIKDQVSEIQTSFVRDETMESLVETTGMKLQTFEGVLNGFKNQLQLQHERINNLVKSSIDRNI